MLERKIKFLVMWDKHSACAATERSDIVQLRKEIRPAVFKWVYTKY
jgi:hypothetical protein